MPDAGLEQLIEQLFQPTHSELLFNPYRDWDTLAESAAGPQRRCANLARYLQAMRELKPADLWLTEAPSWRGARRSGVPLTPETRLAELSKRVQLNPPLIPVTYNPTLDVLTADSLWLALRQLPRLPLLWNALMQHPHALDNSASNRTPTRHEVRQGRQLLESVVQLFGIQRIICIGKVAEYAVRGVGVQVHTVRHPAQGGARLFQQQISRLYAEFGATSEVAERTIT